MRTPRILLSLALITSLPGCVYVPREDHATTQDSTCKTLTRHLVLEQQNVAPPSSCDLRCMGGYAMFQAVDFVVAGSIVLTGNTVHWLEYQGTCSDGYLNAAREKYLKSLGATETARPGETGGAGEVAHPGAAPHADKFGGAMLD